MLDEARVLQRGIINEISGRGPLDDLEVISSLKFNLDLFVDFGEPGENIVLISNHDIDDLRGHEVEIAEDQRLLIDAWQTYGKPVL